MDKHLVTLVLLAALAVACARDSGSMSSNVPPATKEWTPANPMLLKQIDEIVNESRSIGAIRRLDVDAHQVLVNPAAWGVWEIEDRKTFAATVAMYCDQHGSVRGQYVDVIDDISGKKLAHYGPSGAELY